MTNRKEFELTEKQFQELIAAAQPAPYIILGGIPPISQQERANAAWAKLGDELNFDHMSVRPSQRGERFFTAALRARQQAPEARS